MISRRTHNTRIAKGTFSGVSNMNIFKTLIAAALLLAAPAFAQFLQVENAVETSPDSLVLPASVNGSMGFKAECAGECKDAYQRSRLTSETTFFIDDKAVRFDEFRKRYAALKLDDDSYALVNYNVKTNTVTRVKVNQ